MLSRRAGLSATAELSCFKRFFRTYSIRVLLRHDNTTPNLKAASQTLWIYDYISPTNELRISHYSPQTSALRSAVGLQPMTTNYSCDLVCGRVSAALRCTCFQWRHVSSSGDEPQILVYRAQRWNVVLSAVVVVVYNIWRRWVDCHSKHRAPRRRRLTSDNRWTGAR